jgi:hypothetical protein
MCTLCQDTTLEAVGNLTKECCTYAEEISAKGEILFKLDTKTFKPVPLDQQLLQQVLTAVTEWMVETGRLVQQDKLSWITAYALLMVTSGAFQATSLGIGVWL